MTVDGKAETQSFTVRRDPRLATTPEEYARQLEMQLQIRDKLTQANDGVIEIREVKKQLEPYEKGDNKTVSEAAKELAKKLTGVEEELYQTKNRSSQDPLNYPIRLNNKIAALGTIVGTNDQGPTTQSQQVYEELATGINAQVEKLYRLLQDDLSAFNRLVREQAVPAVAVKPPKKEE